MRRILIATVIALGAASCGGQTVGARGSTVAASTSGVSSGSQSSATRTTIIDTTISNTATTVVGNTIVDAASCMIEASNYDQSCTVDSDCATVSSGDYCLPGCFCGGSTINVGALSQWQADVAAALAHQSGSVEVCGCPVYGAPCCRQGKCLGGLSNGCSSAADTLPACADAGGSCYLATGLVCGTPGPPDACAYSDQVCCLR